MEHTGKAAARQLALERISSDKCNIKFAKSPPNINHDTAPLMSHTDETQEHQTSVTTIHKAYFDRALPSFAWKIRDAHGPEPARFSRTQGQLMKRSYPGHA